MDLSIWIPDWSAADTEYEQLRGLFHSSGFDVDAIRRRLGIAELQNLEPLRERFKDFGLVETPAQALIHLFVEGKPLARTGAESILGSDALRMLERLRLIFPLDELQISATVALYPIEHVYIASDRYNSPDTSQFTGFNDIVYPCLFETTARFRRMLSRTPCGPVLDLCSGTGVAALLLARTSEHVWAADITERSRQFALFNQRMNGVTNMTVVIGDLYEPVAGHTFDRIAVHPPYQPVFRHQQIFNSGGLDGEQITRRAIEHSYAHLRPGGRLYCAAQITAREQKVDQRIRRWMTEQDAPDCDIAFYITKRHEIELFAAKATLGSKGSELDFREWMQSFARLRVSSLDYGLLILERHAAPREAFTICRKTPEVWNAADFESSFTWELECKSPDFEARLWSRQLRATPGIKLQVEHSLAPTGGWQLDEYHIIQNGPFDTRIRSSQGLAHLLGLMNGERTVYQCFNELQQAGASLDRRAFVDAVVVMTSEGFLRA
ncbi:MAG TPA: methyltransferase [Bryobacteraceae bacterium]|jgi:SAM-dependent methyltransferase